jgi:hypothetical protein
MLEQLERVSASTVRVGDDIRREPEYNVSGSGWEGIVVKTEEAPEKGTLVLHIWREGFGVRLYYPEAHVEILRKSRGFSMVRNHSNLQK